MTLSVMVHDHKNLYFIAIAMRLFVHQNGSDYPGRKYVNITCNIYSSICIKNMQERHAYMRLKMFKLKQGFILKGCLHINYFCLHINVDEADKGSKWLSKARILLINYFFKF